MAPQAGPSKNPDGSLIIVRGVIALLLLQTTILLAGIPWALSIQGSMSTIETKIEFLAPLSEQYISLRERVKANEVRIQDLKGQRNTGDPFDAVPRPRS